MSDSNHFITSDLLSAEISAQGAELSRLQDREGRDLLWNGDPAIWNGRAPILFPVIGMLNGGGYYLDGARYEMPKHGFARRSRFAVVDSGESAVTFRLEATPETLRSYPFEFSLDIRFSIDGAVLLQEARLQNRSERALPASFGFHPAFRWPLPYGQPRDAHAVRFAEQEPQPIRRIGSDGLLKPQVEQTPVAGNVLQLRDDLFVDDALIFDRLNSRNLVYGAAEGPVLDITFENLPELGIWTKPGAPFLCIEPWQGYADPQGFDGEIFAKPGIVAVAPGDVRVFVMHIALKDGSTAN